MDADRCLANWSRLRGTRGWLSVHLAVVMCFRQERCLEGGLLPVGTDVLCVYVCLFLMYSICTLPALIKVK